jgi:hypothetical protein
VNFDKIFNLGVKAENEGYVNEKIILSNKIATIFTLFIAIPFVGISAIFFPPLAWIPGVGIITCSTVIFLNSLGSSYTSRLMISLIPFVLGSVYNAYLCRRDEEPVASLLVLMSCFSLVPLLVFDMEEKKTIYTLFLLMNVYIFFFMDLTNNLLEEDLQTDIVRTGILSGVTRVIGFTINNVCLLILVLQTNTSTKKIEHMVSEMDENNTVLKQSESQLKENIAILKTNQEEGKQRNWSNEGLSEINLLLRKSEDQNLDPVLSKIISYVSASFGAIFLLEKEKSTSPYLYLTSCYAYNKKRFIDKEIALNEGLIGQCALEKESIYLENIPKEYINVKIISGLGATNPVSLLVVPLMINHEVLGVLELASLYNFEPFQIAFLEKLAESMATSISIDRINSQTKQLLVQSQQQGLEMRAQEEELRQNMEELAATQDEMLRKEQEYLRKIHDLERNNKPVHTPS